MPHTPYSDLKNTNLWRVVDQALQELADNEDIEIRQPRNHVTGYLVTRLYEEGMGKKFDGTVS